MNKWINTKDMPLPKEKPFLAYTNKASIVVGWYCTECEWFKIGWPLGNECYYCGCSSNVDNENLGLMNCHLITYWMPLPEPPNETLN